VNPSEIFLSVRQVADRYGNSSASIWRWCRNGAFPQPIKISAACTRWKLSALERFEAEQSGEAEGTAAAEKAAREKILANVAAADKRRAARDQQGREGSPAIETTAPRKVVVVTR
jgi:prophage regulatory protein